MSRSDETQPADAPGSSQPAVMPAPAAFDECCSAPGAMRPHWQTLISALDRLGRDELEIQPVLTAQRFFS